MVIQKNCSFFAFFVLFFLFSEFVSLVFGDEWLLEYKKGRE